MISNISCINPSHWVSGSMAKLKMSFSEQTEGKMSGKNFHGRILIFAIILLVGLFSNLSASYSEGRKALVIGNANYSFAPLNNPVNDAEDISSALSDSGFQVVLLKDASRDVILQAINSFSKGLDKGDVAMVYFSGHGVQVDGKNYLVPVGATLESAADVEREAIDVNNALQALTPAQSYASIFVLDACRNNPFPDLLKDEGPGLARQLSTAPGTFVSYSTSPFAVALDGEGRNSPYTKNLVAALREPGLSLEEVFKRTLKAVNQETNGQQTPWISSSFFGDFAFLPNAGAVVPQQSQALNNSQASVAEAGSSNRQVDRTPANDAPILEGLYDAVGTNPNGSTYKGTVFLSRIGSSWRFEWLIAGQTFHGIGEFGNNKLSIEWGDSNPVIYTIASKERLEGIWSGGKASETLIYRGDGATQINLTPSTGLNLEGKYLASGINPDGSTYKGTVTISKNGDDYQFKWRIGRQAYQGLGRLNGNILTVDWGAADPVIYEVAGNGTLNGKWSGGQASEVLKRK